MLMINILILMNIMEDRELVDARELKESLIELQIQSERVISASNGSFKESEGIQKSSDVDSRVSRWI